jgi:hypothetical protein
MSKIRKEKNVDMGMDDISKYNYSERDMQGKTGKFNLSISDDDDDIDDDDDFDIVIDIDEDLDIDVDSDNDDDLIGDLDETTQDSDIVLSKHKIEGKHSLKHDSIFKGKKEDPADDLYVDNYINYQKDTIEVDKSSGYHQEYFDNETYIRGKLLKEKVYQILKGNTDLNFMNNRRKPSKTDFNKYYDMIVFHLREENFTNVELFNELSVYFSDNLFNMFKLLDNKWRNVIIQELQEHIGKVETSKEIMNRNIYEGTEVEFKWVDQFDNIKMITGVVIETDYENSLYKIDSFENIYNINLSDITKILNNTKFKYNLNKLNNIDFL